MIPFNAWEQHEPRLNIPVFKNAVNEVDFTVQEEPKVSIRRLAAPLYNFGRKKTDMTTMLRSYSQIMYRKSIRFKAYFLNRLGEIMCHEELPGRFRAGDFFYLNVNDWLQGHNIVFGEGNLILVSSKGRADRWQSSPGNVTLRVSDGINVAGYRTGFFARPLNAKHKHFGFTGLNPRIEVNERWSSGLLFINHSSEPMYNNVVHPTVRLHINPEIYLETCFGEIAPHTAREKSIIELFPNAKEFLEPAGGVGYSVSRLQGATLASVHVLRNRSGQIAALEHSRPTHTNIINYL